MVHPHLISAILNEPWAISREYVLGSSSLISSIFDSKIAFERGEPALPTMHDIIARRSATGSVAASQNNDVKHIQVINITGPVMKHDQYCGPAGMKSMGGWIQAADRDPAVDGILLVVDSPGGTVAGTEELGAIIKGTKKPIVGFIDDLAASAGYWLVSNCDEVHANNTTAQVGSIGVMLTFTDIQPALEKQGVVFHVVTAPQSTHKTEMYDKLRAGDYEEYQNTVLLPLADKFIDNVKSNRPNATEDQFTGKVFFAQDVVGTLIDSISSFDQALQRVAELASLPSAISNPPSNTMNKPELKRLEKAAAVDAFESSDGSITLTADQAIAVEAALEAAETDAGNLQLQLDATNDQQPRITELEGQLQEANERIAELSAGAGAETAAAVTDNDANDVNASGKDFFNTYNDLVETHFKTK